MNHSSKNQVAPSRWARGANAGVKIRGLSRLYQGGAEFKARQLWLRFDEAVGDALEAIADVIDASRKAFKAWQKTFAMPKPVELPSLLQLPLPLWVAWFPLSRAA